MFGGFTGVVGCLKAMAVGDMRVMRGLFVIAVFVVLGGLTMVNGCMLVMLSSFSVVFCGFVVHGSFLFPE